MKPTNRRGARAALVLADGTAISGQGLGAPGDVVGELMFYTAMTGYQEILTDPSYAGQLITFTFPHIGNVGTNAEDVEATTATRAGSCCGRRSPSPRTSAPPTSRPLARGAAAWSGLPGSTRGVSPAGCAIPAPGRRPGLHPRRGSGPGAADRDGARVRRAWRAWISQPGFPAGSATRGTKPSGAIRTATVASSTAGIMWSPSITESSATSSARSPASTCG